MTLPTYRVKEFVEFAPATVRREPKTDRFCVRCSKDIKPGAPCRGIHLIDGGSTILHPEDEALYVPDSGDMGLFLVGSDCARQIGAEWTVKA